MGAGASPSPTTPALLRGELFAVLAESEKKPREAGATLLRYAREHRWPLLALVASCYADVSALSCLCVWLDITVAR